MKFFVHISTIADELFATGNRKIKILSLIGSVRSVYSKRKRNTVLIFSLLFFNFISTISFGQAVGDYRSNVASGNWSVEATWQRLNALPSTWATPSVAQGTPGEFSGTGNVLIQSGHSIIIETSPVNSIGSLTIGNAASNATLTFNSSTDRTLKVTGDVTITKGIFTVGNAASDPNNHTLSIAGNLSVAATCTLSLNANVGNNDFCTVNFNGNNALQTVTGTGTINFNKIIVNKGTSQANIADIQSVVTLTNGGLSLLNGTFKLSSASTIVPFTSDPSIPTTARLWNNGGTMNSPGGFDVTFAGTVEVSGGTLYVGASNNDRLVPSAGGTGSLVISGGLLSLAGRISNFSSVWSYSMTSGTLKVCTAGSTFFSLSPFNMNNTGCSFSMSGGTIVIVHSGGFAGENLGFRNIATGGTGFTGGTLEIGDATTPSGNIIRIETSNPIYNLTVNSANATAQIQSPPSPTVTSLTIRNNVTISNGILDASFLNLNVGGNWTNSSSITDPLLEGTRNITFNGSAVQTISNTANANGTTFYGVTIDNNFGTTPQVILATNTVATHDLTLTNGTVNMAGNVFTLGKNAATSVLNCNIPLSTSWLYGGTFKRFWPFPAAVSSEAGNLYGLFPVGGSTASSYRPFEINVSSIPLSAGYVTVNHVDSSGTLDLNPYYDDGGTNIVRIHKAQFKVATSGLTGGTYDVRATMTDLLPGDINDIRLAVYTGGTTAATVGAHDAATGTAQNPTARRMNLSVTDLTNDYRIATINREVTPLPIRLLNFTAEAEGKYIRTEWITATEINNDYFILQRSRDLETIEDVGKVDGAGNSSAALHYQFIDKSPIEGLSYYRLKQVDFDGTSTVSNWTPVNMQALKNHLLLYPNPATSFLSCEFFTPENGEVTIDVTDITGKIVIQKKEHMVNGLNKLDLDISDVADGLYFLSVSGENFYDSNAPHKIKFSKVTH